MIRMISHDFTYFLFVFDQLGQVWAEYAGSLLVNGGACDASLACRGFMGERGCRGEAWRHPSDYDDEDGGGGDDHHHDHDHNHI